MPFLPPNQQCQSTEGLSKQYTYTHTHTHKHTHTTILQLSGFYLVEPRWAGTRRNIHPLTSVVIVTHALSTSSICYDPWHPPCSIYVPDSLFPQSLSKFSLVYLLAWHPPLHTPYISSHSQCLLFTAHAHTIATCFAVVPRLCHLIRVSLSTLYLQLNDTHPSDHSHLCPLKWYLIFLSYRPGLTSMQHTTSHITAVQSLSHYQWHIYPGSPGQNPESCKWLCVCVRACMRASVHACVHACVCACVHACVYNALPCLALRVQYNTI